ncbi:alkaline phosphatase PhoX, partial [Pasteurella multocida]|uniref:alkaline phosphatase PhoX n=1 Tax=Pasteurella multocida TaxID=747 RepID=UPI00227B04DA
AATGGNALEDYRNAFNTFGYIVEIDPFNQSAMAVKRTALGRFAHENCAYAPVEEGKPVVMYMGDDARGEYIYKFVSDAKWSNADIGGGLKAGDKYLDKGTLYVAVF